MKIIILKENLQIALSQITRIATQNTTLPVLMGVCLEAKKGQFFLKATNLEIGIIIKVRAAVERVGSIIIPTKILTGIISGIGEKRIEMEKKGEILKIKTTSSSLEINSIKTKEFPIIPLLKKENSFSLFGKNLSNSLEQVLPSVSISNMRPDLAGVYFKKEKKLLKIVATDGFRLTEKTLKIKKEKISTPKNIKKEEVAFIVPSKTAMEISKIFYNTTDLIDLFIDSGQIAMESPTTYLVFRVIDGNYPEYLQIIPKKHKTELVVDKVDILNAIKLTSLFSSTESNDITLKVDPKTKTVQILSFSSKMGKVKKEIKALIKGNKAEVVLNHRFLFDGIANTSSDKVMLRIGEEGLPILITPSGEKEIDYVFIISPIKKAIE